MKLYIHRARELAGISKDPYKEVILAALGDGVVKVTKYLDPKLVVRATRTRFRGRLDVRDNVEMTLTIGRPNYAEREFIKVCQKAGEPFPVKKVQIKHLPVAKKSPKRSR